MEWDKAGASPPFFPGKENDMKITDFDNYYREVRG